MTDNQIKEVEKLIVKWINERYNALHDKYMNEPDTKESDQEIYNVSCSYFDALSYWNNYKRIAYYLIQLINAGTLTKNKDMQDDIGKYFEHADIKDIYKNYIQACSELNDFLVYAEKYLLDCRAENDLLNYIFVQYSEYNDKNIYAKLEPYLDLSLIPDKTEPKPQKVIELPF